MPIRIAFARTKANLSRRRFNYFVLPRKRKNPGKIFASKAFMFLKLLPTRTLLWQPGQRYAWQRQKLLPMLKSYIGVFGIWAMFRFSWFDCRVRFASMPVFITKIPPMKSFCQRNHLTRKNFKQRFPISPLTQLTLHESGRRNADILKPSIALIRHCWKT